MDTWIDLGHAARGLRRRDAFVLLTDGAVGDPEEENLRHLAANMAGEGDGPDARGVARLVPFLTCMHSLEYCLLFADRARRQGVEALTVVGGDTTEGIERCLPHSHLLRARIRDRHPELALGGWVNPHRDAQQQASYIVGADFAADYVLTQVVSHHDERSVEAWQEEQVRRGIELPSAWGVFYYRNGDRSALEGLAKHFRVPVEGIGRDFEEGASPEVVCARSIVALRRAGVTNVYVCNLGARRPGVRLDAIRAAVEELTEGNA
jgi:hypothetical protein